jgi:RimJ/RimL family protein N-acetyltransferase
MLIGDRVRLRAVEKSDLPVFVRWLNDPEVRDNIEMIVPRSMGQEEGWYADMLSKPVAEQPLGIEIRDGEQWLLIGNISFMNINQIDRNAEIGIFIGEKNYRGQGYGTEAMRMMLRHGFDTLNFERIYLRVHGTNPGGIHSYQKAGFVEEGRLRNHHFLEGRYIDVLIMGILKDEWFQQKNGGKA